jgi:hypothetical protein
MFVCVQDDTYTESYISTIGVDFVRPHLSRNIPLCNVHEVQVNYVYDCRKSGPWSSKARSSNCRSCVPAVRANARAPFLLPVLPLQLLIQEMSIRAVGYGRTRTFQNNHKQLLPGRSRHHRATPPRLVHALSRCSFCAEVGYAMFCDPVSRAFNQQLLPCPILACVPLAGCACHSFAVHKCGRTRVSSHEMVTIWHMMSCMLPTGKPMTEYVRFSGVQ